MTGALKILATPIGNIKDLSKRALEELLKAKVILAEDTRHTKNLLGALGIATNEIKIISCNSHNEKQRIALVQERLLDGFDVVLVSDAGSPAISDPGSLLIKAVIDKGLPIEVLPGPSALTAALMGSGLDTARFIFLGFLPKKEGPKKKLLNLAKDTGLSLVIFESPLRVLKLLQELHEIMGPCGVVVARELTKKFEVFHRGFLGSQLEPSFMAKGECVVIVENHKENAIKIFAEDEVDNFIKEKHMAGYKNKEIVNLLITKYNFNKNKAYDLVLKMIS